MKYNELKKKLKKAGWSFLRQGKGSHEVWQNAETKQRIIVANHGSKEVPTGTANKILKDAGLK